MRVDYECRLDYSISRYPPGGARVTLDVNFHNVKVQDWMRFGDFADGYPPPPSIYFGPGNHTKYWRRATNMSWPGNSDRGVSGKYRPI